MIIDTDDCVYLCLNHNFDLGFFTVFIFRQNSKVPCDLQQDDEILLQVATSISTNNPVDMNQD